MSICLDFTKMEILKLLKRSVDICRLYFWKTVFDEF